MIRTQPINCTWKGVTGSEKGDRKFIGGTDCNQTCNQSKELTERRKVFFYCWRPPFVCFVSMLDFWVHVGSQKVPHMLGSGNSFLDATASPAEPFVPDWVTIKGSPFDHPGLCPAANAGQQPCEAFLRQQQGRGRESMKVERVVHTLFME